MTTTAQPPPPPSLPSLDITSDVVKELGFRVVFERGHLGVEHLDSRHKIFVKFYEKDFPKTIDQLEEGLGKKTKGYAEIDKETIFEISACVNQNFSVLMEHHHNNNNSSSSSSNSNSNKKKGSRAAGKGGNNDDDDESSNNATKVPTLKYTTGIDTTSPRIWETVRIGATFCFVSYDQATGKIHARSEIEGEGDNASRTLVSFTDPVPEPIAFKDRYELEEYIQIAKGHTLGTLFFTVRDKYVCKFYDTDTQAYIDLIAADILFTYFADRVGKTHYLWLWGDPGSGKGAIIETFHQLGYRVLVISDETAATIFRSLGNVEKGQIVIIIDEANYLEKNPHLVTVFKVGYKGNTKIPRVMDAQSSALAKTEYYYAYGLKILASENLPKKWIVGGLMDRCMFIHSVLGKSEIDVSDVVDNAGDPENAEMLAQLVHMRKILFAYRLLHYHEPIPDIEIEGNIIGRDLELVKPLLRLFRTHGHSEKALNTLKESLHYFIKERNREKTNEEAAEILKWLQDYFARSKPKQGEPHEVSFADFWTHLEYHLDGKPNPDPDDANAWEFNTIGRLTKKRLGGILKTLGGNPGRDSSGTKRVWVFDPKTLERMSVRYRAIPDTIEIVDQTTLFESTGDEEE
jgi:hypothetical protein